jgi:hypothetical protein
MIKPRDWRTYEIHPYALKFRAMSPQEFDALKEDIRENGVKEKIYLFQNKILDGRNRFQACLALDKEGALPKGSPQFEEFKGDDAAARRLVTSLNMTRRHLSKSEMAMRLVLDGFVSLPPTDGSRRDYGTGKDAITDIGRRYGISHVMLYKAAFIAAHDKNLAQQVANGKKSVPVAEKWIRKKLDEPAADQKKAAKGLTAAAAEALQQFALCEASLRAATQHLRQLRQLSALTADDARELGDFVRRLREILKRSKPGTVCPDCQGRGCAKCQRRGWLPRGG